MEVTIKSFDVSMSVKQKGMELQIKSPDGKRLYGDCYITNTKLIWCKGQTTRENGIIIKWEQFVEIFGSKEKFKAALAAAKKIN